MELRGQSIISASHFNRPSLHTLFSLARRMRRIAQGEIECVVLRGRIMGSFFFEESTRTRLSSEVAFKRLGGEVLSMTDMRLSSIVKGETFEDSIRVLGSFCDLMVIRSKVIGEAATAARISRVPIVNAGDGAGEHPTQALLDLFTIVEERRSHVDGITIAMVGDLEHSRTVHSLVRLLCLYDNITFHLIAPSCVSLPADLIAYIQEKARQASIKHFEDLDEGLKEVDVLYVVRPQVERFASDDDKEIIDKYRIDRATVERVCKSEVIIMHPLPRTSELATDVDDMPSAAYFRMIENGTLIRMALFTLILGKEEMFV